MSWLTLVAFSLKCHISQPLSGSVEGIEGAGDVVKPTLDDIMAKLGAWA